MQGSLVGCRHSEAGDDLWDLSRNEFVDEIWG